MKEIFLSGGRRRKERKNMVAITDRLVSEQCLISRTDGKTVHLFDIIE